MMFRAAAIAVLLASCSPLFVKKPVRASNVAGIECTTSNAVPILDAVLAASFVGLTAYYGQKDGRRGDVGPPPEVWFGMFATGYAISSLVGFLRTDDCREQKREYATYNGHLATAP